MAIRFDPFEQHTCSKDDCRALRLWACSPRLDSLEGDEFLGGPAEEPLERRGEIWWSPGHRCPNRASRSL